MAYFTVEKAKNFMAQYLSEDKEGFDELISVEFMETIGGVRETCGGCTLGDGQDCRPPTNHVDVFKVVCKNETKYGNVTVSYTRFSHLRMGWADGGCSNSFGDYNEVEHFRYENNNKTSYATFDELAFYCRLHKHMASKITVEFTGKPVK